MTIGRALICAALLLLASSAANATSKSLLGKGEFDCQEKGSLNHGVCKRLGRGMCTFTADASTVKLRCTDVRR